MFNNILVFTPVRFIKKKVNNDILVDDITNQIIIGVLLGDSRVDKQKVNYNSRLCFEQGELNKDYLFHLFEILKPFCGVTHPTFRTKLNKENNKLKYSYLFKTLSYPCFNYYYYLFYSNGSKIVPSNIEQLLTPVGLAYWAMDDGGKTGSAFNLHTQGFTHSEVVLLVKVLKDKFDLDCNIHSERDYYKIYIKTDSMVKFKLLVSPHFHPSMMYKLA